ncbi:MAG: leucine-rich repeat domain-containing protein [Treponema sp.]|nr:leucine-rich repeat domain-containing protein [Treponema sp.]
MSDAFIKKHGLLYSTDLHTVIGVDDTSTEFKGRIPYGARAVDAEVFSDCPYQSISIPDSVKELGPALFENSLRLETVKLPANVTELPPYLFSGCSALYKVTMPSTLTALPEGLFKGCASLTDIPFRAGIKVLPEEFMSGCTSIKSLVVPNTVEIIGPRAVANCSGLESLVLPESVREIAEDAFEGCNSIHTIRIEGESEYFFIKDGSLYQNTDSGEKLVIKAYSINNEGVNFFKDNVDDEPIEASEDEEVEDDDTFFSAEIGASDEEMKDYNESENKTDNEVKDEKENINDYKKETGEGKMDESNIDSMLADIMGDEKKRTEVSEEVAVSDKESEVLAETMAVMEEDAPKSNVAVTTDELENLFSKHEEEVQASNNAEADDGALDKKSRILVDTVEFSKVLEFEPAGEAPADPVLFVIAEKTVETADGKDFSPKLISCCKTFARIHDFKRVIMLAGLPLDNEEFEQFYFHYMNKKNVILACEAESPATLSDYCKKICQESRISLDKDELNEQRKRVTIKTDTLIKLVIRDKYDA